jgi:hypothetical protein
MKWTDPLCLKGAAVWLGVAALLLLPGWAMAQDADGWYDRDTEWWQPWDWGDTGVDDWGGYGSDLEFDEDYGSGYGWDDEGYGYDDDGYSYYTDDWYDGYGDFDTWYGD